MRTFLSHFSPVSREHRLLFDFEGTESSAAQPKIAKAEVKVTAEASVDASYTAEATPEAVKAEVASITEGAQKISNVLQTEVQKAQDSAYAQPSTLTHPRVIAGQKAVEEAMRPGRVVAIPAQTDQRIISQGPARPDNGNDVVIQRGPYIDPKLIGSLTNSTRNLETQEQNENPLEVKNMDFSQEIQERFSELSDYKGMQASHKGGTSYEFTGTPQQLAKLENWARKHGMEPKIEGDKLQATIAGFDSEFGFYGPKTKESVGPKEAGKPAKSPEAKDREKDNDQKKDGKKEGDTKSKEQPKAKEKAPDAVDEAKEEVEKSSDRAERIHEETKKTLDELDKKYGVPKEEKSDEGERNDKKKEDVKEVQEDTETEKEQRKRLWAEVRGEKPEDAKTVEKVKEGKQQKIREAETKKNETLEPLNTLESTQRKLVSSLESQLQSEKGKDPKNDEKISEIESQLTDTKEKLATTTQKIEVAEKEFAVTKKKLESDRKMLDIMDAETTKLAKRSDRRLAELGRELKSADEVEVGRGAEDITVKNDTSLGFAVDVPTDLVKQLELFMTSDQKKDMRSDNPAIVLRTVDAALKLVQERAKKKV